MKRSTIILLFVLVGLILFTLFSLLMRNHGNNVGDETNFTISNIEAISKVKISHQGRNLLLSKDESTWVLNDKYQARQHLVDQILEVFETAEVKAPIAKAARENVIKELSGSGHKVEVYTKSKDPVKTYFIGGSNASGTSTYMVQQIGNKIGATPYEIVLPGFSGYVTNRFTINEEEWRSKEVFGVSFDDENHPISDISIEYSGKNKHKSFDYQVSSFHPKSAEKSVLKNSMGGRFQWADQNESWVINYINQFKSLPCEAFENDYALKDSVVHYLAYCTLKISGQNNGDNAISSIEIYHMPVHKGSSSMVLSEDNKWQYDPDAYFAYINDRQDWVILQKPIWDNVLVSWEDFLKE